MTERYAEVARVEGYRIVRDTKSKSGKKLSLSWFDRAARQTRRRTLNTEDIVTAVARVQKLVDRGIGGDPGDALHEMPLRTVGELLDAHAPYIEKLASAQAGYIQVKRLKRLLGDKPLTVLVRKNFEEFRDACLQEDLALSTVDRTLGTLVAAGKIAVENRLLAPGIMPKVPKFFTKNHARSTPPKGRVLELAEIAELIDAAQDLHLLFFLILLINTGSRPGALLDLCRDQIDLPGRRLHLNPANRVQTKKWRPVLPIPNTLLPWVTDLLHGHLITYRGKPIKEIDTAFISACCRAGLPGGESSYSIRHSLGRYMRKRQVDLRDIALWLGHTQPPDNPEITLVYSPDDPDYLTSAKTAVEAFVLDLNRLTKRDLLTPPSK